MAMKGLSKQEIEARMNQQKTLLIPNMGAPQRDGLKTCQCKIEKGKERKQPLGQPFNLETTKFTPAENLL